MGGGGGGGGGLAIKCMYEIAVLAKILSYIQFY